MNKEQTITGVIRGTGACVPKRILDNKEIAGFVDTSDEWIRERTGVRRRRIAEKETTVSMACEAGRQAVEEAGISSDEIDMILVATGSPDQIFPCTACRVQEALGADGAVGFDLNAACSGFLFAYNTAQAYIASGIYRTVLVIGSESISRLVDWTDRGTCILFGDGAGAAVLKADEKGIIDMMMGSDGTKGPVLACQSRTLGNFLTGTKPEIGFMTMDGQEVFRFAVKKVPESVEILLKKTGIPKEEIKYYVLHQANERIIEAAAKRLKEPMDKFPMSISRYGNTSTASIPLLLNEMVEHGMLEPGDKIVMSGFGAGMTWGAVLLEW